MNETRALEDAVRDRALALDLEALRGRMPRTAHRGARWSSLLAAVALMMVVTIAVLERGRTAGVQDQDDDAPEPPVVHSRAEVEALPAETEAVVVLDGDAETLSALSRLRGLRRVVLSRPPVGQRSPFVDQSDELSPVAELADLASLREIEVADGRRIEPAGLAALDRLPILESLVIKPPYSFQVEIGSDHVEACARLALTELVFELGVTLEERALRGVATLSGLHRLKVPVGERESMEDVLALRALTSLRALSLGYCATDRPPSPPSSRSANRVLDDRLADLVAALPKLRELRVDLADYVTNEAWLEIAAAHPWQVFALGNVPEVDAAVLRALPSSVRLLEIGDGVADGALEAGLPDDGERIEVLHLPWRDEVDASWIRSFDLLPRLRELDLSKCLRFATPAIRELPVRASGIRVLNLAVGPHLEAGALEALGQLHHLRELNLSGIGIDVGKLSPFGVLRMVKERRIPRLDQLASLSELRSLNLDNCAEIPVAELRALADLPLRSLSLRKTPIAWDAETPDIHALRALWPDAKIDT